MHETGRIVLLYWGLFIICGTGSYRWSRWPGAGDCRVASGASGVGGGRLGVGRLILSGTDVFIDRWSAFDVLWVWVFARGEWWMCRCADVPVCGAVIVWCGRRGERSVRRRMGPARRQSDGWRLFGDARPFWVVEMSTDC